MKLIKIILKNILFGWRDDVMKRWMVTKFDDKYISFNRPISYLDILSVKKRFYKIIDVYGSMRADQWVYGEWENFLEVLEGIKPSFLSEVYEWKFGWVKSI